MDEQLPTVSPQEVGSYLDQQSYALATKKPHLSAIRHFFDTLATLRVVLLNPVHSERSERLQGVERKTPEFSVPQARCLMPSLNTSHVVGLKTKKLTLNAVTAGDMARMVTRRMRDGGLPSRLSTHPFPVATITNLLSQGVLLDGVRNLTGHADPPTTRMKWGASAERHAHTLLVWAVQVS
ncbi:hypothetical protein [Planctomycetes bacterium TBK1r]|uniref:hypothetical protein n=1 Tax=Stieleria magnilauensis TaxID=2527963 RepID=UPI0011A1B420